MTQSFAWLLVEAGTSLFEVILIVTFLNGFLKPRELPVLRKVLILCVATSLLFVGSTFLSSITNLLTINFLFVTMLISFSLYTGKLTGHFFSCILLLAILVVVETSSAITMVITMKIDAASIPADPFLKLICVALKNIISFAIIKVICNFRKSVFHEKGRKYFAALLVVPLICTIVALYLLNITVQYGINNTSAVLVSYLGLMYINVIVFGIFEAMMRLFDREYKYKMIEKQLELQLNHYNKLAENRAILREALHDFKNHLNCIYNLYKYNNTVELGRYIENLINVSDSEKVIDTGNPVIDALLNDKFTIAKQVGIEMRKELNLPSNLMISPTDICAILGNALDNAIEACRRMPDTATRQINLSMTYRDSYLVIVITNTIDQMPQKEGKFFRSSKPSPELHGLGMHSIERTVRKYDGNMVVKCDQGLFKLEIVMPAAA